MSDFKLRDITRGLVYTAITSDIGEFMDTDKGAVCCFGDIEVRIADEYAPDMSVDDILCMVDMKELSQVVYKSICITPLETQKEILNYINDNL